MESLIGDFVQFISAIAKFLFLEWRLDTNLCLAQFFISHENFSFPKILVLSLRATRQATRACNFW